jgi:hypothetical protein
MSARPPLVGGSHRWQIIALSICGAGVLIATILPRGDIRELETKPPTSADTHGVDGPHELEHCGGELTTLDAELARNDDYVVLLPDDALASASSLRAVYRCPAGTQLEYESGISVFLGPTDISDSATAWKALAKTAPDIYSVSTVRGFPAFLSDAAEDPTGVAEGAVVAVMEEGTYVAILGNGVISLDDLVSVGESLKPAN